jgi:hypothetical protein
MQIYVTLTPSGVMRHASHFEILLDVLIVTIASRYTGLTIPFGYHPLRSLLRLSHLLYVICTGFTQPSTALTQLSYFYYLSYACRY